jgi:6-pyruvoyltetrahydropterin/6-carboxytetrahydropterin synthase
MAVRLGRSVRFSVSPFLETDGLGHNSYTSKPAGDGLSLFLQLTVELAGPVNSQTGFLINVVDIDRAARDAAVPVFAERIRRDYRQGKHMSLAAVAEMLAAAWDSLDARFGSVRLNQLVLNLNPFRTMAMKASEPGVVCFSEKFEFAAMHKLWNDAFSEDRNFTVFGKCANPAGHGHNYLVEVTVSSERQDSPLEIGRFEAVVNNELIALVDHKNLNLDVPELASRIPTVENLAMFAWSRLAGKLDPAQLHSVTVWESDRTYCTYRGENAAL